MTKWEQQPAGNPTETGSPKTAGESSTSNLFSATRAVPWEANAETWQFTFVGSPAVALLGYPCEDWYEQDFWIEHIHPEDRERAVADCRRLSSDCDNYEFEYRMIGADGAVVWVLDLVRVKRVAGEPHTLSGLILDITSTKELEISLRESTDRFRMLLDSAPDAMLVCREDGTITLANKQAERMFGYSGQELVDQTVDRLVPEGLRAGHPELRSSYMAHPQSRPMGVDLELSCVRKDGSEFPVEIGLNSFDGTWGKGVIVSIRDVSVRKRAEASLVQHRNALVQSAQVSTAGALAGSLSHELNQPLTAIVSNAQAALRLLGAGSPDADLLHAALTDIVEEGKRSSRVIRQLRAMLETGETEKIPVDLNGLVGTAASLARGYGFATDASIELDLAPDLPPVLGDATQIQQVILNLLVNAFEALESQEGMQRTVIVGTIKTDAQAVEVFVRDYGVGLEFDVLDRAFDAFFTTKQSGLGMGLSICKSIVEAHGGQVWPTRNPDRGTTFHVSLPCSPAGTT